MKPAILIILLFSLVIPVSAQETADAAEDTTVETWYVWIDAQITKDGESYRLVSQTPFQITCCVKSPKYRKLGKKAQKWVTKNYDQAFSGDNVLSKVQDEMLAKDMIAKIIQDGPADKILVVDYIEACN